MHIESFLKIKSPYRRSKSKIEYLDATLNVPKMYELYLEICSDEGWSPVF